MSSQKKRKRVEDPSPSELSAVLQSVWEEMRSKAAQGQPSPAPKKKKKKKPKRRKTGQDAGESTASEQKQQAVQQSSLLSHAEVVEEADGVDFHPFPTDFCDHFETPLVAYEHLKPVLQALAARLGKDLATLRIYDPFYCSGTMVKHLTSLGCGTIIHSNRDFWKDVDANSVPEYDILVTNPPFSGDHKPRLLRYCVASRRPWAVLVPTYVTTKQYFTTAVPPSSPFYIVPQTQYEFEHPTGKGHDTSPFTSLWCVDCCDPALTTRVFKRTLAVHSGQASAGAEVVRTVAELAARQVVRTGKRKNPKQRRRQKIGMA